jgi:hypothetical protein
LTRYDGNRSSNQGERQHIQKQMKHLKMSVVLPFYWNIPYWFNKTRVLV